MRKITSILLSLILMLTCYNVFAAVTVDDASCTVTLSGTLKSGAEGVFIGIDVFCPNMGYEDLREASYGEYKKVIVLRKQIKSEKKGAWTTDFRIYDDPDIEGDAPSGTYTAIIFSADEAKPIQEKFDYLNLNTAEDLIEQINKEGTQALLEEMLQTQPANLGLLYDFVSTLNVEKTAALILAAKEDGRLSNAKLIDNINAIRSAALMQGVSQGCISNLFDYADVLGLNESALADYYKKYYVKDNYSEITKRLTGTNYVKYDDFIDALCEQVVLQVVQNSDGIGNIKEIVALFDGRDGWTGSYSDDAYLDVQGKTYENYQSLKEALDDADDGNGGGGGGSSGGNSGSGLSPVSPGTTFETETPTTENTTMEYNIFDDIEDISWAKDAIVHLAQLGIINGKTQTKFFPNDTITREELAKILVLTYAKDVSANAVTFRDADPKMWYYPYISRAVAAGIVNGYSKETFGVGSPVTRQEMCTMIYRAAIRSGVALESGQIMFDDETQIADYAKDAVCALAASGIVVGNDLNHFEPHAAATRAQVAKIIYRLMMQ